MATDELVVEVVYAAAPHRVARVSLKLPPGATVAQALRASGIIASLSEQELDRLQAGVWGRVVPGSTPLRPGDRVELYRPLTVDPKEARRLRYRRDGVKRRPVSGNRSK
jgi:putative ubiquitin-RnfH superfamily antitoxin RatB of RatAB toxin-antitoxin module